MKQRLEDPIDSPLFNSLAPILDVNLWPKNQAQLSRICDWEIKSLRDHFEALLELNQCVISSACNEWDCLKAFVLPMITGVDSIDYLEVCPKLLTNKDVQRLMEQGRGNIGFLRLPNNSETGMWQKRNISIYRK